MSKEQAIKLYHKFIKANAKDTDELPYTHYLGSRATVSFYHLKELLKYSGWEKEINHEQPTTN